MTPQCHNSRAKIAATSRETHNKNASKKLTYKQTKASYLDHMSQRPSYIALTGALCISRRQNRFGPATHFLHFHSATVLGSQLIKVTNVVLKQVGSVQTTHATKKRIISQEKKQDILTLLNFPLLAH